MISPGDIVLITDEVYFSEFQNFNGVSGVVVNQDELTGHWWVRPNNYSNVVLFKQKELSSLNTPNDIHVYIDGRVLYGGC